MSSHFPLRHNRYLISMIASQLLVGASVLMIAFVLTDGWLW